MHSKFIHRFYPCSLLLEETLSHLVFAFETKYIPEALYKHLESEGEEIDKMLNGYIAFLKKSKQGVNEPGARNSIQEDSSHYFTEPFEKSADIKETDF